MPSQNVPLRKDLIPGGKTAELPEKSCLLSPTSHHLQVSIFTALKCVAAAGRRGSNARRRRVLQVGRTKAELQGGRLWPGP